MKFSCFKCKWLENDINLNTLKKFQTQQHRPTPTVPEEKDKIHSNLRNFLLLKVLTWIYYCFQCILAVLLLKFSLATVIVFKNSF